MSTSFGIFENTAVALEKLKDMFKCLKCQEFTTSPVTLGGCEHIYCSTCCEEYLGSACPVCNIPAHVKDADVDRQLFNLASLCARLGRVLVPEKTLSDCNKENVDPQLQCTPNQPIPSTVSHDNHVIATDAKNRKSRNRSGSSKEIESKSDKTEILENRNSKGKSQEKQRMSSPKSHRKSPSIKRLSGSPGNNSSKRRRKSLPMDQKTLTQYYEYEDNDSFIITENIDNGLNDVEKSADETKDQELKSQMNNSTRKQRIEQKVAANKKTRQRRSLDSSQVVSMSNPRLPDCENDLNCSVSINVKDKGRKEKLKRQSLGNDDKMPSNRTGQRTPVTPKSRSNTLTDVQSPGSKSGEVAITPKGRQSRHIKSTQSPALSKRNAKGETPLQVAAIKNDITRVKELLSDGANPNVRDNAGWTPLHEACNHGYVEVAELLLNHGAMMNIPGLENDTPLHDAINNGQIDCVCLLVSRGASLTLRNVHGQTAVDIAQSPAMKKALKTPVISPGSSNTDQTVDLLEYQTPCLLGTGLSREEKVQLQKSAAQLKIKLLDEVTPEVTHIVTKFNNDGMCPRTIKIVQGILMGKWILNMEWLKTCSQLGNLVCEEAFEAQGTSIFPNSQSPMKGRMNRKQQLPGLFDGCHFYFHGSFDYAIPSKDDLVSIIQAGGGKFLSREPKPGHLDMQMTVPYHADPGSDLASCCVYIIYDKNVGMKSIQTKYMCTVPSTWIMDCASNFQLMVVPVSS